MSVKKKNIRDLTSPCITNRDTIRKTKWKYPGLKNPEFKDDDRPLNDEEIDWLLSDCYQVGLISSKDLEAMGNSIKKSFEALKKIGNLDELTLEESAWSFMALDSVFGLLENRVTRDDRRVKIAGNTGLPRKKS